MTAKNASSPKRAAVVINPAKAAGSDLRASLVRLCDTQGWAEPLWLETTEEDPGVGQARQALEAGVDVVIAAGGDGTVRCVAEVLAGTDTPLGLVPLGTGNLLARNMGVEIADPVSAAYDVLNGTERTVDVVRSRFDQSEDENVFLVMAGRGLRRRDHGRHRGRPQGPHGLARLRGGRHPQAAGQAGEGHHHG